jgi:pSer/pThr/pTyr-binding forkhead associated (FHA) protein
MLRLIFRHLSGSRRGTVEVYPTSRFQNLTIGRDPGSDVRFHADQDVFVSRHHAIIEWKASDGRLTRFTLVDLLSSNGTYLNGIRLGEEGQELNTGDHVQFGRGGPDVLIEIDELPDGVDESVQVRRRVSQTQEMPAVTFLNHRAAKDPPP